MEKKPGRKLAPIEQMFRETAKRELTAKERRVLLPGPKKKKGRKTL
jgi:hypothetical protein